MIALMYVDISKENDMSINIRVRLRLYDLIVVRGHISFNRVLGEFIMQYAQRRIVMSMSYVFTYAASWLDYEPLAAKIHDGNPVSAFYQGILPRCTKRSDWVPG